MSALKKMKTEKKVATKVNRIETKEDIVSLLERSVKGEMTEYAAMTDRLADHVARAVRALKALNSADLGVKVTDKDSPETIEARRSRAIASMIRGAVVPVLKLANYRAAEATISVILCDLGVRMRSERKDKGLTCKTKGPKVTEGTTEDEATDPSPKAPKVTTVANMLATMKANFKALTPSELKELRTALDAEIARIERDAHREALKAAQKAAKEDMKK